MSDDRWGRSLTLSDLPDPEANWMEIAEFALTFEGYGYAASLHPDEKPSAAAHRLYEGVCEALHEPRESLDDFSVEDLRCALFRHQRMVRWNEPSLVPLGMDASGQVEKLYDSATQVGREIVRCIRERLEEPEPTGAPSAGDETILQTTAGGDGRAACGRRRRVSPRESRLTSDRREDRLRSSSGGITVASSDTTIWGIHAGRSGEADSLFRQHDLIAQGGAELGDLSKLAPDRETFKEAVARAFPEMKPGAIPVNAGQYFRFVHEMQVGDLVAYPAKHDRRIHLGRVTGPYRYDAELDRNYPHQRPVEWLESFSRSRFSQGALYEVGAGMTFFQVKNYSDEFIAALAGEPTPTSPDEDATISIVADEIAENTRDFILKQLAQELKGHPFADFVAHLLETMGYRTRVSPPGPDGGIDIIAHRDELGFEPPIVKVQVKSTEGSVGDPATSALYGKVSADEFGLLVTLGTFTNQAITFADGKSNLRLIDGLELVDLILLHYEQLDSRYKGLIPLKRVYVPEALEEPGE